MVVESQKAIKNLYTKYIFLYNIYNLYTTHTNTHINIQYIFDKIEKIENNIRKTLL